MAGVRRQHRAVAGVAVSGRAKVAVWCGQEKLTILM